MRENKRIYSFKQWHTLGLGLQIFINQYLELEEAEHITRGDNVGEH